MAEPVRSTPEFPLYDTYPGKLPPENVLPQPGGTTAEQSRMLPSAHPQAENLARRVGVIAGRALREVPRQIGMLRQHLTVISGGKEGLSDTASDLSRKARRNAAMLRTRANDFACERPIQVILGAAAVAFILGLSVRVWRGNRG